MSWAFLMSHFDELDKDNKGIKKWSKNNVNLSKMEGELHVKK